MSEVMNEAGTNAAELTVGELSGALKRTLEDRFGFVRVRGEISGYRGPHASGHVYFCLKDSTARLDAVIWKQTFARMKIRPTEGLEVVATGRITSFPSKSTYQIVIDTLQPAGVGALMALLEERRRRLAAEGLFDQSRKRALPFLPETIGVVTSPTGAVIRDILHRLADRFPRRVLVWPARVQGDGSAEEIAAAIRGFNALASDGEPRRPSVLIVARGGGSLEDLWGFNEELVVRAVAESAIPVISAVGHETDWTLIDHVADVRAPTPTGAAEFCVPVRLDLVASLADLDRRRARAATRFLGERGRDLRALARALPRGEDLLAPLRQRLDRTEEQLAVRIRRAAQDRRVRIGRAAATLARHSPQAELARRRERLRAQGDRLDANRRATFEAIRTHRPAALEALRGRLETAARRVPASLGLRAAHAFRLVKSFSYKDVLARGYVLARDAGGRPIRSAASVAPGARLTLSFADGDVAAQAEPPARRKAGTKAAEREQGALF